MFKIITQGLSKFAANSFAMVKAMQTQMQLLSSEISQSLIKITQSDTIPTSRQGDISPLGDFLVENFMPKKMSGVEFSPHESIIDYKQKQKTETKTYKIKNVLDSIDRIGKGRLETQPDGIWGFRTDNALKNILGLSFSFLKLEKELGLEKEGSLSKEDLKKFHNLLSGYKVENGKVFLSPEEKGKRAREIIEILSKIRSLFNSLKTKVMDDSENRDFLEGKKSVIEYSKSGSNPDQLNEKEKSILENFGNTLITGLSYLRQDSKIYGSKQTSIPLKALESKANYLDFMKSLQINEQLALKILPLLVDQISKLKSV